jgi:REP element-mobilizing transposase RayT
MTGYRRNFIAGGCFFFTVNLADRRRQLLTENIDALRTALRETQRRHPFSIDAIVVLPDHLHTVWTLPKDDADFSTRWRLIKTSFGLLLPGSWFQVVARLRANAASGSVATGSIRSATRRILSGTSTMCTLTPSNTGLCHALAIGRIPRFAAW